MIAWQYNTIRFFVERYGVLLKAMEHRNTVFHKLINSSFIFIFKEADEIEYKVITFIMQFLRSIKQFVNTFFTHYPAQIKKMSRFVIRIILNAVCLEVHSRAVKNHLFFGRNYTKIKEFLRICSVFKEHLFNAPKGRFVQHGNKPGHWLLLKSSPKALYICEVAQLKLF